LSIKDFLFHSAVSNQSVDETRFGLTIPVA
jgi:hypothetical protein